MPDTQPSLFPGLPPRSKAPVARIHVGDAMRTEAERTFPGCTASQAAQVLRGRHPMGHDLPGPEGETCGTCGSCVRRHLSCRTVYKCRIARDSGCAATDTRVKWPACKEWTA